MVQMVMMIKNITTGLLFLLASITVQAVTLQGKVVHIADGNTLTILTTTNQQVKISPQ